MCIFVVYAKLSIANKTKTLREFSYEEYWYIRLGYVATVLKFSSFYAAFNVLSCPFDVWFIPSTLIVTTIQFS